MSSFRINKRMTELGICSRRKADEWIEQGLVLVNGQAAEIGQLVGLDDRITLRPEAQQKQSEQVTILLNKPISYVSSQAEAGYLPAISLIKPENHWREDKSNTRFVRGQLQNLATAGRLDIDSTGLLIFTQDGRIAKKLIGENSLIDKEYLVRVSYGEHEINVSSVFPAGALAKLRSGLSLDGQKLKPAEVVWQNPEQLRFVLHEGKKRQIRRMCELVGLRVCALKRVRVGRVMLGHLPIGQWRYLNFNEKF